MKQNNRSRMSSINFNSMNFGLFSRLSSVQLRKMGFRQACHGNDSELERQGGNTCQNILLAITIIQFFIIVVMCTMSVILGEQLCNHFVPRNSNDTADKNMAGNTLGMDICLIYHINNSITNIISQTS